MRYLPRVKVRVRVRVRVRSFNEISTVVNDVIGPEVCRTFETT